MIKARTRPRMNVRPTEEVRIPSFTKWLRGRECLACGKSGHICQGRMHAHHVKSALDATMKRKGPDNRCVPLCAHAHDELHTKGAETFERKYAVDLVAQATSHFKAWPGRNDWERQQLSSHIENT